MQCFDSECCCVNVFSRNLWIKFVIPNDQAVALYVWCRRRCCKLPVNYTAVNHGLDEEEMAFKRTMETQHADDIDEVTITHPTNWLFTIHSIRLRAVDIGKIMAQYSANI